MADVLTKENVDNPGEPLWHSATPLPLLTEIVFNYSRIRRGLKKSLTSNSLRFSAIGSGVHALSRLASRKGALKGSIDVSRDEQFYLGTILDLQPCQS